MFEQKLDHFSIDEIANHHHVRLGAEELRKHACERLGVIGGVVCRYGDVLHFLVAIGLFLKGGELAGETIATVQHGVHRAS